jgi:hypothetical protein
MIEWKEISSREIVFVSLILLCVFGIAGAILQLIGHMTFIG